MTDVFDKNTQTSGEETPDSFYDALVGEGKKFTDNESLAKGKHEADEYIKTLEGKLDALKADLDKSQTAQEVADQLRSELAKINASSKPGDTNTTPNDDDQRNNNNTNQEIRTEDLERLVEEKLAQKEKTSSAQRNLDEVNKVLLDKVGATAPKYVEDKAAELGVTVEYLKQQAAVSPKAFYNLISLNTQPVGKPNTSTPPQSSISVNSDTSTVRNQSYYNKLYKENPKLKYDAKMTIQEHKDALALGEAFFE